MIPTKLLQPLSSVSFERQTQFAACQDLSFARNKYFRLRNTDRKCDVQSIGPPDFSVKLYSSLSTSEIRERKKNIKIVAPQPKEMKRRYQTFLPNSLSSCPKRKEPPKFITSHRPPDALETELMFVKIGKYHSGTYKNHKPHDFRPVSVPKQSMDLVPFWNTDTCKLQTIQCVLEHNIWFKHRRKMQTKH